MNPSTIIRPARPDDIHVLARNHRAMALETEGRGLDARSVELGTQAVLEDSSKGFYLIAERQGETVGQLLVTFEWSDWRNGTFWWIQSVYVIPGARRTGVYRSLHERVLALARQTGGVCGIRLYVEHENQAAQTTYSALGMQRAHYDLFEIDFVLGPEPQKGS